MATKTMTPLRYPGGKTQVYNFIKELVFLNNCTTYIEPFMGGMGVALKLLLNNDVQKILVNDYDKSIYAFWYSVLNYTDELIAKIKTTDITIEEWKHQKNIQKNKDTIDDLLELGFSTLFLNRTNRSGIIKAGVIGGINQTGAYKLDCRFNKNSIISKIEEITNVKHRIRLYNQDAEKFIRSSISRTKRSLTFFDPPYYSKGSDLYTSFYKHNNHQNLANTINQYMLNKKWILTYDNSPEIYQMYSKYNNIQYQLNYSVAKPSVGIEYMFYSPNLKLGNPSDYLYTQLTK